MDLKTFYDQLEDRPTTPKTLFIDRIMKECDVTRATVYRYLNGTVPDKLKRDAISRITGIPVHELFPQKIVKEA